MRDKTGGTNLLCWPGRSPVDRCMVFDTSYIRCCRSVIIIFLRLMMFKMKCFLFLFISSAKPELKKKTYHFKRVTSFPFCNCHTAVRDPSLYLTQYTCEENNKQVGNEFDVIDTVWTPPFCTIIFGYPNRLVTSYIIDIFTAVFNVW